MTLPLPTRLLATYFPLYADDVGRITDVPTVYNQIHLFQAEPAGGGAYKFPYGNAVNAAEVKVCRDRGQRVVLTIGGANAGFAYTTRAQSQAFLSSFVLMANALGNILDGCDFNNFEAGVESSPDEMIWIAGQLKVRYGPDFSISCPPHPTKSYDRGLTKAMANAQVLDYAAPQFYDSPDWTTEAVLLKLIPEWVANVGGAGRVVIGAGANYSQGALTAVTLSAWKKLVAKYPDLRGVFGWSAQEDAKAGWSFGKTLAPIVVGTAPTPDPTAVLRAGLMDARGELLQAADRLTVAKHPGWAAKAKAAADRASEVLDGEGGR